MAVLSENLDYFRFLRAFRRDGFVVIPNFLDETKINVLLNECSSIVRELDIDKHRSVFKTGQEQVGDDYFLQSGDKVSFFFEEKAFNSEGKLVVERERSLNKIGHALHWHNPVFKEVTFSNKIKAIVRTYGFDDPVVVQSMVIFKNPRVGGQVVPHQDASFLFTKPQIKLIGFWLALSDATKENGCLWFIPGSHKLPVARRFVRNPDSKPPLIFTAPDKPYSESDFVPAEVKKGSLVLIHGCVVHKSETNNSDNPRPAYTFHIADRKDTKWADDNWLQPTESLPFPSLNDN